MDAKRRMLMIRMIYKMDEDKTYSQKLGLKDQSKFHGESLKKDQVVCQG